MTVKPHSCYDLASLLDACIEWFDGHPERWCRRASFVHDASGAVTSMCMMAAIGRFGGCYEIETEARSLLLGVIPGGFPSLAEANDSKEFTHAMVMSALRTARNVVGRDV